MESIIAIVVDAMASQKATDILVAFGIYVIAPILTHINVQFIKYDRRERDLKELGRWSIRGIAVILTFTTSLFLAWRVGGWDFEQACNHAMNSAIMYPALMWAYMAWLKKKDVDAYNKLTAPRRRKHKKVDLDETNPDNPNSTTWAGDS